MLFVTYWELDEGMSIQERQRIAETVTGSEQFPPEGVEILRWDATPDGWGVTIWESDDVQSIADALNVWRASGAGFFETTKTAPAAPTEEFIRNQGELLETLPEPR